MDIRVKIAVNSNSIKLQEKKIMQLKSQEMRKLAPELDPLRIGTGRKKILEKFRLWLKAPMVTAIREADI